MSNEKPDSLQPISVVWLRRDLRLHDHAALSAALAHGEALQPIFIFDTDILARFTNKQDKRLTFLAESVCYLHDQLQARGGGLLVLYGRAEELVPKIANVLGAARVVCAEDFEPATQKRDAHVKASLGKGRVEFEQVLDHLIHHPHKVMKGDGTAYKVFTPYSKAWRAALDPASFDEKPVRDEGRYADFARVWNALEAAGLPVMKAGEHCAKPMLEQMGYEYAELGEWKWRDGRVRLNTFVEKTLNGYKDSRDFVADRGTSKLSPFLRFGMISARECARLAAERPGAGSDCWMNELIWREFYAMILANFPDVVAWEFQEQYRGTLEWSDNAEHMEAWKRGQTGYPIVDAAMRQLVQTGWMHNRARMIVASFFTKDIHADWRVGEEFFAQHLMDYDLASNNGGWQWAASTGTDAQPYFRIFNPVLQSKRFDQKGEYIRRYVPELAEMSDDDIHAPWESMFKPASYPLPIVEHHLQKDRAVAMFKEAASKKSAA